MFVSRYPGSDQGLDSAVTILLAFFGLLLPGLLGSLAAIGVPLGKVKQRVVDSRR